MFDVRKSPELQAAILAYRQTDSTVTKAINKDTRSAIGPRWQGAIRARTRNAAEDRVFGSGARVRVNARGFQLTAATSRRPLRGGLDPASQWAGFEFGAHTRRVSSQQRSRRGRLYTATRMINRQFRGRQKEGRIAFDASSEVATWAVAQWVRSIVNGLAAAGQGKVQ